MSASLSPPNPMCRVSQSRRETRDASPIRIGYARAYARPDALAAETAALTEAGCATVFADDLNGAAVIRPALAEALAALRPGDCLAVAGLDRLTWRLDELLAIASEIEARGASLWSARDGFDTRTADAAATFHALAAFAADVTAARAAEAGRSDPRQKIGASAVAAARRRVQAGEVSMKQAAKDLGVSRATLYRRVSAEAAG